MAAGAVLAAVLLCACGAGASAAFPQPHYHGSPVPSASADPVYPDPSEVTAPPFNPPPIVVGLEMENALSNQIGRDVSMTPHCVKALKLSRKHTVVRCYARWGGVAVPFKVTLTKDYGSYYTASSVQLEGLLVASAVRTAWAQFNYATGNRLSCARDLPQAALVPFGKPTKYLCSDGSQLESVQLNRAGFGSSPFSFSVVA